MAVVYQRAASGGPETAIFVVKTMFVLPSRAVDVTSRLVEDVIVNDQVIGPVPKFVMAFTPLKVMFPG